AQTLTLIPPAAIGMPTGKTMISRKAGPHSALCLFPPYLPAIIHSTFGGLLKVPDTFLLTAFLRRP
ncbi:MAG: hypothetical protein ABR612_14900, partial [Chromatocurvus sp.]